jgi:sulfate permease, SulP family
MGRHDVAVLLTSAVSMFVVILAQSAATARAYASKYGETLDEDADLVGLGVANVAAAFSGTFVVNGSPTKTQIADTAGGRSQLTQLVTSAVVLVVLLLLTGLLTELPIAALAAVVFVIGAELVDVRGMASILAARRPEFYVALLAAAAVVVLGVRDGIILAIVASVIDHLRHSYRPLNSVLAKSSTGHWEAAPVTPGARTEPGLVIYRFGTSLYYANASRLAADITTLTTLTTLTTGETPLSWLILDGVAIGDVDYTAASVLSRILTLLHAQHVTVGVSSLLKPVRHQLERYGITGADGPDAYYDTAGEALDAYRAAAGHNGPHERS